MGRRVGASRHGGKLWGSGGALTVFHIATTSHRTDTHPLQQVSSSVGMIINTAIERSGRVLADRALDQGTTTRVIVHKRLDIVNDALDQCHGHTLLGRHLLEFLKGVNGQLGQGGTPNQLRFLAIQLLLLHPELSLFDLVGGETLQIRGQTEEGADRDEPFGGVVLIKADRVPVIRREFVVKVVVTTSKKRDKKVSQNQDGMGFLVNPSFFVFTQKKKHTLLPE